MQEPQEWTSPARDLGRQADLASRANRQKWLQRPRANPHASLRLVCLPYSGGRASVFKNLAADLPGGVELLAVEYPGHGRRLSEVPITRLAPLVEQITDVIIEEVPWPFALLGYSVGALIGFEVTRELARRGQPGPTALFVAANKAPHLRSTRPALHELSRHELIEGLHRLAGVRNELLDNDELVDVMLPVLRADLSLDETYTYDPGALLDCPVVAFGGSEDWSTPRPRLEAWREQTTGDFSVAILPGGHFFLDSSRAQFAQALTAELERLRLSRGEESAV
jgi:medium-chain acyl-[acyl-carrier-protein] hydrolase